MTNKESEINIPQLEPGPSYKLLPSGKISHAIIRDILARDYDYWDTIEFQNNLEPGWLKEMRLLLEECIRQTQSREAYDFVESLQFQEELAEDLKRRNDENKAWDNYKENDN